MPIARKARFNEVRRLHGEGHSLRSVAASMRLHHRTVERCRSDACPDWCPGRRPPSGLDRFSDHIGRRVREGCRNTQRSSASCWGWDTGAARRPCGSTSGRVGGQSGASHPAILRRWPRGSMSLRRGDGDLGRPSARWAARRGSPVLELLEEDDGEIGEAIEMAGKFAGLIRGRLPGRADGLAGPCRGLVGTRLAILRPESATGRGGSPRRGDGGMEQWAGRGPGQPVEGDQEDDVWASPVRPAQGPGAPCRRYVTYQSGRAKRLAC